MLKKVFAHLCIVVSVMMVVFIVINAVNPAMGFLKGDVFETFLTIYVVVSLAAASLALAAYAKHARRQREDAEGQDQNK